MDPLLGSLGPMCSTLTKQTWHVPDTQHTNLTGAVMITYKDIAFHHDIDRIQILTHFPMMVKPDKQLLY